MHAGWLLVVVFAPISTECRLKDDGSISVVELHLRYEADMKYIRRLAHLIERSCAMEGVLFFIEEDDILVLAYCIRAQGTSDVDLNITIDSMNIWGKRCKGFLMNVFIRDLSATFFVRCSHKNGTRIIPSIRDTFNVKAIMRKPAEGRISNHYVNVMIIPAIVLLAGCVVLVIIILLISWTFRLKTKEQIEMQQVETISRSKTDKGEEFSFTDRRLIHNQRHLSTLKDSPVLDAAIQG